MTRDLRWDCSKNGCFRNICPKLGAFDDCFPGKIGMSDIDGAVEISGRVLFLEWKSEGGSLSTGQRIMFEQMTRLHQDPQKVTVIIVHGHPRDMVIDTVQVFRAGRASKPEPCDFDGLKARISSWADRAQMSRVRLSQRGVAA